jgi:hypothetical protein
MDTQSADAPSSPEFDIPQFKQLYQTFDEHTVSKLPQIYSPTIIFKDPIHQLHGLEPLRRYFANFCQRETYCQFEFVNQIVGVDQAFFQWNMHYSHPKLNAGKRLMLNGGTLIKFESHITYHEDFYDMGAMIYRHLPVLGWAVKKINNHMKEQ